MGILAVPVAAVLKVFTSFTIWLLTLNASMGHNITWREKEDILLLKSYEIRQMFIDYFVSHI